MNPYGDLLRQWRGLRRFSQLELSLAAGTSARHISFLERGRARPSRDMVLRLAQTLGLPRPTVNTALLAAGFAPVFPQLAPDDDRLEPVHGAIDTVLRNHLPMPAVAFDGGWNVTAHNASAAKLFGPMGLGVRGNIVEALISLPVEDGPLLNWTEVVDLLATRLRAEIAQAGEDGRRTALLEQLLARRSSVPGEPSVPANGFDVVLPLRLQIDGQVLAMFSMIAQFGSVQEVTMADLHVELFFAEDEATRRFF